MRKIACFSLVAVLALSLANCGPKPPGLPAWVDQPPSYTDAYAAVGISSPGLTDVMSRTQAEARGRAGIARIMESRVADMIKDFMKASSSFRNEETIISEDQFTQDVSRSISKQTIKGARVKEYYTRPSDGVVFALVVLSKESVMETSKKELWDRATKMALYNEFQANKALKELDAAIEKEYGAEVQAEEVTE